MNFIKKAILLGLSTSALWISCGKKEISVPYQQIDLQTNTNLNAVHFINNDTGFIAAGQMFFDGGAIYQTTDGGVSWQSILNSEQAINDINFNPQNRQIYAAMFGNKLFKNDNFNGWSNIILLGWQTWKATAFNSQGIGFMIAGRNFGEGKIQKFDNQSTIDTGKVFAHELSDIINLNDSTFIAVGYGIVLKTDDTGENWRAIDVRGDFYKAVHFPSEKIGYIVGEYGSILKTTNGGENWQKVKRANTFSNKKNRPQSIYFVSDQEGYLVGKAGLFAKTTNGGEDWTFIQTDDNKNWKSVFATNEYIFLVGEAGVCWRFAR